MRLALVLCVISSSVVADSNSLSLALPSPPMNYQSDSFSTGTTRCSNAVGGGINLEYGVTGVLSGLDTNSRGKNIGVYARVVIPLDKPKSRINCDDLYQIELTQRRLEIQKLRDEIEQLRNLQNDSGEMEFEN
jgi:phage tail sheath protein FI